MQIPSGTGTAVVPLPHPYIGKLADKLSEDVKINNKNAATKGSKSKHDDAMHMQLPGTIKFVKNPNKEGEVTNGTGKKLKINGKEAAVIGSTVTTCNDMGMKDNSTILAVGASMPMPAIINPLNMEEYKLEREKQETKSPEFTTVKWNKTKCKEGEELELSAQVKDIDDSNMVTFQVFRDGQDPNTHVPYGTLPATIEGGKATAKWFYKLPSNAETIPESDPQFFFSAHSAWCQFKKSSNATIELKRPEISNPKWMKDGSEISEALVDDEVMLSVEVKDIDDGETVGFEIWENDENNDHDFVGNVTGIVQGGKVEAAWKVRYTADNDDSTSGKELAEKGYTLPEYHFVTKYNRAESIQSGVIEVRDRIRTTLKDSYTEQTLPDTEYIIFCKDGSKIKGQSDESGYVNETELTFCHKTLVLCDR
jgi:uncharacterized Zn-binding protein involved in type VI secretion